MSRKKFRYSETGSVSIYLIIILTALFFLNAVLIDYARILAANNQTEKATKAALRSVFSAYDQELYNRYGLFGLTNNDESEIFQETIGKNLYVPNQSFNFIELELDEASISLEKGHYLANHVVFEQQILEDMKYVAPISLTEEVIDSFTSFSKVMNEATKTTKALSSVSSLYEERQKLLNEAVILQKDATSLYYQNNSFSNLEGYVNGYDSYVNNLLEYERIANSPDYEDKGKDLDMLNRSITSYQEDARKSSLSYNTLNSSKHQSNLAKATDNLQRAKELNNEIIKIINDAEADSSKNIEFEQLRELTSSLNDLVLEDQFFVDFENDLKEQLSQYNDILIELRSLSNITNKALRIDINSSFLSIETKQYRRDMLASLNNAKELDDVYSNNNFEVNNQQRSAQLDDLDSKLNKKEIANKEKEAKNSLDQLYEYYQSVKMISNQQDQFLTVDQYYQDYLTYNSVVTNIGATSDTTSNTLESSDLTLSAMTEFNELLSSLPNILETARNELYVNEYALNKFNSFDLTMLKGLDEVDGLDGLLEVLNINNQEIEYIIYGSSSLGGNIAYTLEDIFYIRLAIRTAEGLFKFKGHPLAVLVEAVTYGVTMATSDLFAMIDGKEVEFSTFTKRLTLDYEQYLRLLLLLNSNKTDKLARTQAVITYNTGKELLQVPTYIEASSTTKLKMWFLPGVMKSLNLVGILDGKVDGNRYKITKTVVFAY